VRGDGLLRTVDDVADDDTTSVTLLGAWCLVLGALCLVRAVCVRYLLCVMWVCVCGSCAGCVGGWRLLDMAAMDDRS
jgi:hypothetical protein